MSLIRSIIENERGLHMDSVATDSELVLKQDKSTLLNALKAVDGAGSGLDADLVRGAEPVKLSTAGTELTKIDGSTIKNQCTAWVNFDGTDGTIRDSYNVSSVVRNDTGRCTLTFVNEMDDNNYCIVSGTNYGGNYFIRSNGSQTTTSFGIGTTNSSKEWDDVDYISVAVFGGKN